MKLRRHWVVKVPGAKPREMSIPELDFRELSMEEGAAGVELWESVGLFSDDDEPVGSSSSRLLVRYRFGGKKKIYRELHEMGISDFPAVAGMYSDFSSFLGTMRGWLHLVQGDVVIPCYDGEVPPVRVLPDTSG